MIRRFATAAWLVTGLLVLMAEADDHDARQTVQR